MTPTEQYIEILGKLKAGDLGLLRTHAGQGLDESVDGFDLFAGLWWPLRQNNEWAPRREAAWLIAKLFAFCPISYSHGETFASRLGLCKPDNFRDMKRFQQRFDRMLSLPIRRIEPELRWSLDLVAKRSYKLDWVKLTDDLSFWERESRRLEWAKDFLETFEGGKSC
ncbi:MAG: type I-E CRISPR-associated protein Cse2/CasB [Nitrospiraceae bacterium]|nr:type I-E CRISPR-associated protein Cse2/CasB [Nitrospiraceae bacterium]